MTARDDCKRFKVIRDVGVLDDLTGEILTTFRDFARALNTIDERANKNAEMYYDLLYEK